MQSCTGHMLWYRLTSNRLSRSLYMFSVLGYKYKMEKKMSNDEYQQIRFWKKNKTFCQEVHDKLVKQNKKEIQKKPHTTYDKDIRPAK